MRIHTLAVAAGLALRVAVGTGLPLAAAAQTDSAGVQVMNNPAPRPNGPAFRLSATPRVSIGTVEGDPAYQLFNAHQAHVLSDGSIVVANTGTQELRVYDRTGKHLSTGGKTGEGPGEFSSLVLVGVTRGDSLVVMDVRLKRYSVFDRSARYVRSFPFPSELGLFPAPAGVLADGRIVALDNFVGPGHAANGRLRPSDKLFVVAPDGSSVTKLGEFPGMERSVSPTAGTSVTFGRGLHVKAARGRIAVANDDTYSIRIYDGAGRPLQIVRQEREPVRVRDGDFEAALPPPVRPGAAPNNSPVVRQLRPLVEQMHRHTTLPAFGGESISTALGTFRFDAAGNLWVQEYLLNRDDPSSWQAFTPGGAFIGRLDLPAKTTLLDVGNDWALVRVTDELDVEHILLYGLERP